MRLASFLLLCVSLVPLLSAAEPDENPSSAKHQTTKGQEIVARLGISRFWHDGGIGAIAASSDGKLLATEESSVAAEISQSYHQ